MTSTASKNLTLALCSFIFLLLGLITAAIGPALPQLAQNAGAALAQIGTVFTAMFLGALVSQLAAGPLGDRIGHPQVILGGLVLTAAGVVGMSLSGSLPPMLLCSFLSGLGHGGIDLGGNVLIATVFNGRSVPALNILNLFFGLGAFAGPTLVSLSLGLWQTSFPALWLCSALMLAAAAVLLVLRRSAGGASQMPRASQPAGKGVSPFRSGLVWALGLIIMVYVGTENGLGGWTTAYLQRTLGMAIENGALVTAGFWLALTGGRLACSALGMRLRPAALLQISLGGAVIGGGLLALGVGQSTLSIIAIGLVGFSFGAVYPTVMAITTERFPDAPGQAVSLVAAMGSIGGALLPWLQGVALENLGNSATAWFTLGGAAVMLGLMLGLRMRLNRPAAPQPARWRGKGISRRGAEDPAERAESAPDGGIPFAIQ